MPSFKLPSLSQLFPIEKLRRIGHWLESIKNKLSRKPQFPSTQSDTSSSKDEPKLSKAMGRSARQPPPMTKPKDGYKRPPLEWLYAYLLALLLGYWLADLGILYVRQNFLSSDIPIIPTRNQPPTISPLRTAYNGITDRNIFNADGIIPPPLSSTGQEEEAPTNEPVLSRLPLKLIGTIVHINPAKSVATIQVQSRGVIPYIPNDDIETMATLLKVERNVAVFRNLQNNRLEYIEIKAQGLKLSVQGPDIGAAPEGGDGSVQGQGNNFSLKRSDLNQYMENLPALLQQARAVPNIDPGTGAVNGFRLVDIQPGSIYERLGLRRNDLIKGVNGEPVNDPAKAMELYNRLRTDSNVTINIGRDGRDETLNFSITE